ncbi:peptidase [Bacillus methanolicus]|uniref:ImmA/IrrE family metallo-endopeptidase n=1 Tax=Bacillus methanolicus TaxID=1471 RepID=UPI0023800DC3|nr:ImmA/IrrE family metallo-endopeptidase [Bacillus methanolicus]MDE3840738.1 peptidase [Bacillus methanolicus]
MKTTYTQTYLEEFISNLYKSLGIFKPHQISEEDIAAKLGILFFRNNGPAFHTRVCGVDANYVDARDSPKKQREQFFHELCHVLRHVGSQSIVPFSFREWQELDAKRFVKCAAIPFDMVKDWDLDDPEIIKKASKTFCVTQELCQERLLQIRNRIYINKLIS